MKRLAVLLLSSLSLMILYLPSRSRAAEDDGVPTGRVPHAVKACDEKIKPASTPGQVSFRAHFYEGWSLADRDRAKNDLLKLALILEDARLLIAGQILMLPSDMSSLGEFRLREVLNTTGQFYSQADRQMLYETSPVFRFVESDNSQIELNVSEKGQLRSVLTLDLGPFRNYGLIDLPRISDLQQNDGFVAFQIQNLDSNKELHVFSVAPGSVESRFPIKYSLLRRWSDISVISRTVWFRTDKLKVVDGSEFPIYDVESPRPPFLRVKRPRFPN